MSSGGDSGTAVEAGRAASPAPRPLHALGFYSCYLAVTLALQWWAGAYTAPLGAYPDESAHFLSCLLLHDYIRAGLPQPPLQFASEYYLHLPNIAIGYWPPVFYLLAGCWMFVAGVSRASLLWFIAATSAGVCLLIQRETARRTGLLVSFSAGLLFSVLPVVAWSNTRVMVDVTVALFAFLALLAWAGYLENGRPRHAVLFGLWASAAALAKTSGMWVFLLFPAGLLLARKKRLWTCSATYWPVAIALCTALPWFVAVRRLLTVGLPRGGEMGAAFWSRLAAFPWPVLQASYWPWLVLGAWLWQAARWRKLSLSLRLMVMQPLIFVGAIALTPVEPEPRYSIAVLPALLVLLADSVRRACLLPARRWSWWRPEACAATLLLLLTALTVGPSHRAAARQGDPWLPRVVASLLGDPALVRNVVLVSSKGPSGDILVELAVQQKRRTGVLVARANRLLVDGDWMGERYALRYSSPSQVLQALDANCVGAVLVAANRAGEPHHGLLLDTLSAHPARFRLVRAVPQSAPAYKLYSVAGACPTGPDYFRGSASEQLARRLRGSARSKP